MNDLQGRGKALEDLFFGNRDHQLLDQLRKEIEGKEAQAALAATSGISDSDALAKLTDVGVTPESLSAVSIIPLVVVGWSDRIMDDSEKEAILKAAESSGIEKESAAFELLGSWLGSRPGDELLEAWKSYIVALKNTLDETSLSQLKTSVINRSQSIAEAAGGFLGIGSVSESEKSAIAELSATFE